jgi:hypothetical protein
LRAVGGRLVKRGLQIRVGWTGWIAVLMLLVSGVAAGAQANQHTDPINLEPLTKQAWEHFYNLDYEGAEKLDQQIIHEHPNDPMAWNFLLTTVVFRELYHQDLLDTTYYAHDSFLTNKRQIDIPQATRNQIEDLTNKAIGLADAEIKANPNDANAYFARGYAKGIHASFITLADHAFATAARQGYSARNDSEQALKIDPNYADARMAIGLQQFAADRGDRGRGRQQAGRAEQPEGCDRTWCGDAGGVADDPVTVPAP